MEFVENYLKTVTKDSDSLYDPQALVFRNMPEKSLYGTYEEMKNDLLPKDLAKVVILDVQEHKNETTTDISVKGVVNIKKARFNFTQIFTIDQNNLIKTDVMNILINMVMKDYCVVYEKKF